MLYNMTPFWTPLTTMSSYHLLMWGSLLGTELYQVFCFLKAGLLASSFLLSTYPVQSFLMTKLCYLYLPRPQFTSLQKRIFPVYFALQTTLTAATVVTYPSGSLFALIENKLDAATLGTTLGITLLNWLVFGPRTSQSMVKRTHQGTIHRPYTSRMISSKQQLIQV